MKTLGRFLRRIGQGRTRTGDRRGQVPCGIEPLESGRGFRLIGDLDFDCIATLRKAIEPKLHGTLVFDLSAVVFLGEMGMWLLLWAHKHLRERGGSLIVRSPSGPILKALEMTGVGNIPGLTIESHSPGA